MSMQNTETGTKKFTKEVKLSIIREVSENCIFQFKSVPVFSDEKCTIRILPANR